MAGKDMDKAGAAINPDVPGPDVMLSLWASWMDQMSASARSPADLGTTWSDMTTNNRY